MAGIIHTTNDYLIARGRVYFDPFDPSGNRTGEIALGNCPGLTITIDTEKAEHFSSEEGLREKDGAWLIQVNRTGTLTCDNFSPQNAALWLSGTLSTESQTNVQVTDEVINVLRGRIYQLGVSPSNPVGTRGIDAGSPVEVYSAATKGGTKFTEGTDYELDLATGRIQIKPNGGIAAGGAANIYLHYKAVAGSYQKVASGANAELSGALRVVASNATGGAARDWYMPKVTLTPNGDLALVAEGTDVVQMQFGLEVLKSANQAAIYSNGRPVA